MFLAVFNSVVPIFGLIFLGWFCSKRGLLGPTATQAMNQFVIYLALPALLFVAMARADLNAMSELGYVLSFCIGTLFTSLLYLWMSRKHSLPVLSRLINAMSASYANSGFMGIPLIMLVFGDHALPIAVIGAVLTVAVQFAATIIVIEVKTSEAGSFFSIVIKVAKSLLRNPILIGTALGIGSSASGIEMPSALMEMVDLLGDAATPCALLTIGLFLAQSTMSSRSPAVMQIVWLKLLVHPASVAVLALFVFDLDPLWAWCAILATALPVGTGPFMLSNLYKEDPAVSARAILISTIFSIATLTALITWVKIQGIN
jgi:malonate transporter and related proteins